MNLSQVVQQISDTYNSCEQLWIQVGLQSDDIQQRREAFLQQFLDFCQSFQDQQQAYYDFVNTQVIELTEQVKNLSAMLDLSYDIPSELDQTNKCKQLKQLERLQKSLIDEIQRRVQSRQRQIAEILVKSETCGLSSPAAELEQILGCTVSQLEGLKSVPLLAQLGALSKLNQRVDEAAGPRFEEAGRLAQQVSEKLKTLGRLGLEIYMGTPDFSGRSETDESVNVAVRADRLSGVQLRVLSLALSGQYQPRYNSFLETFCSCLSQEIEARQVFISSVLPELRDLEALFSQATRIVENQFVGSGKSTTLPEAVRQRWEPFRDAGLSYFDPALLTDHNIDVLKRAQGQSVELIKECITFFVLTLVRAKYSLLQELLPKNNSQYQQVAQLTMEQIYQISQQPSLAHYYASLGSESQKQLIRKLISQLNVCETATRQTNAIQELLKENETLKQSQIELEEITSDKSRFTSRSREALQKRKREDQIKKQLNTRWPKLLGQLQAQAEALGQRLKDAQISLNDCQILFTKDDQVMKQLTEAFLQSQTEQNSYGANQQMLHEIVGSNFDSTVNEIVLLKDKTFQNRYKEYYAFAKKEIQRELAKTTHADNIQSSVHESVGNRSKSKLGMSYNSLHNSVKSNKDNYNKYPAVIKTPIKHSSGNSRTGSAAIVRQTTKHLNGSLTMSQIETAI